MLTKIKTNPVQDIGEKGVIANRDGSYVKVSKFCRDVREIQPL